MEQEQVLVTLGYDPKEKKYGLIFDFVNKQRFCVTMNYLQIKKHINELTNLMEWASKLPEDEKELEIYPRLEIPSASELNDK
jgi:hypothetical protein